jgi:hypothetical protein
MEMYARLHHKSLMESMSGYEPVEDAEHIRYNQLFNDANTEYTPTSYGSLRSRDPGGLPLRVIDPPRYRMQYPTSQTTLDDF